MILMIQYQILHTNRIGHWRRSRKQRKMKRRDTFSDRSALNCPSLPFISEKILSVTCSISCPNDSTLVAIVSASCAILLALARTSGETDAATFLDTLLATASTVFSAALIFSWVVVVDGCFLVEATVFFVVAGFLFQEVMIFFSVAIRKWKINYLQHTPTQQKIKNI